MRIPSGCLLLALILGLNSRPASAAVVDLFAGGAQVAATGNPLFQSKSEIFGSPGDFEKRYISIPFGGGHMEVAGEAPGLSFDFLSSMATGANTLGYLFLHSESADPVSLIGDGEEVVRISFSQLSLPAPIQFQLNFFSAGESGFLSIRLPAGNRENADIYVPMSKFGDVDFSAIKSMTLQGGRFESGTSFVVDSITTVPETSLPLLSIAGGLVLVSRRPRRK
jgi:hypothetical protein